MENKAIIIVILLQLLLLFCVLWNKHLLDEQAKRDGVFTIIEEVAR